VWYSGSTGPPSFGLGVHLAHEPLPVDDGLLELDDTASSLLQPLTSIGELTARVIEMAGDELVRADWHREMSLTC
jgi:hypothetical protein